MRFFFYAVYIHMKRIMISGYFAICAITVLLIFAAGTYLSESQDELIIKIGIIYDTDSKICSDIHKILTEYPNLDVTVYKTEYDAQKAVISGEIACVYVFGDVLQKLADKDFTDFATSLQPPYNSAGGVINQLIYSAILKATAPQIAYDYLQNKTDISISYKDVQDTIDGYFKDGIFVKAEEEITGISPDTHPEAPKIKFLDSKHIIHGIIALVLFLFMLLISADQISDKRKNIYFRMSNATKTANEAAYSLALFITGMLLIFISVGFIKIVFPEFLYSISSEITSALSYIFCLTAVNMLLSVIFSKSEHIYANAAVIFIIVCIFGNIFFDISALSSALGAIQRVIPTSYFIWSLKSETSGTIVLVVSGFIIYTICLLSRVLQRRA